MRLRKSNGVIMRKVKLVTDKCSFKPPQPKKVRFPWFLPVSFLAARKNLLSILADTLFTIKMGKVPLLTRSLYFVNAPETFKPILKNKDMNFPKSKEFIYALRPLLGDSIFTSNGDVWLKRRAMVEPSFASLKLRRAFPDMKSACEDMVKRLKNKQKEVINLDAEMAHITADIIYRTIFSRPLTDADAARTYTAFNEYIDSIPQWDLAEAFSLPNWVPRRSRKESYRAGGAVRDQMKAHIDDRMADPDQDKYDDMLSVLLGARYEDGTPFSDEELIDELALLFMAGHETSAAGLTWATYLVLNYPDTQARMRKEALPLVDGKFSYEESIKLKYTKNVFKEALRLYPPIAFLTRQNIQTQKVRRWNVKAGSMVFISPWVIHRHKDHWQEPDDFVPERFEDKSCAKAVADHFIPFSMGQRVCPGAAFALLEGPVILAYLFSYFDVKMVEGQTVLPRVRISTRPQEEIQIRVKARFT